MMRKLLSLGAGLTVTTYAAGDAEQTGACVLNGAQAVSDMTDAAIYTWAATQRCSKGDQYIMKCEVDAAQAVESANKMVNVIVQTVDSCQAINDAVLSLWYCSWPPHSQHGRSWGGRWPSD